MDIHWVGGLVFGVCRRVEPALPEIMVAASKCANLECKTPHLPVKSGWCTSGACKKRRAAQKAAQRLAAAGSSAAFIAEDDGTRCFEVYYSPCTA